MYSLEPWELEGVIRTGKVFKFVYKYLQMNKQTIKNNIPVCFIQSVLRSCKGEGFLCPSRPVLLLTALLKCMEGLFLINVSYPSENKTLNFVTE